jgi:Zn-dependent peptidase ImmA (M78 family)
MLKTDRKKVLLILNWCTHKFKKSKYNKQYPKLRVYKTKGGSYYVDLYLKGYYTTDTNTITIFLGSHNSIKELCNTMIHEYKHYLLDSNEYDILYNLFEEKTSDHDSILEVHPHEIKCKKFATKWQDICYKDIKELTKINKNNLKNHGTKAEKENS